MAIFILNKTSKLEPKSQKRVESAYKTVIQTFFVLVVLHDTAPLRILGFG